MPPTVHLIRHAEGTHNLSAANYSIHDPGLTARGEQQARDLAARITELQADGGADIDLVLASPLRRTLTTALAGFAPQLARKRPAAIYAWPDVQEVSALPCDCGSALAAVQKEFGRELVNYDIVENGWELKQGKYANTEPAVTARAQAAREWLRKQPHKDIAVFSHGCLLHFLTDDWEGTDSPQGTSWDKTELRSFTFSSEEKDDAVLVETLKSRERRGSAPALTGQEQKRLRKATMRLWTEWGILE
ncbi:hypothetical protein G3M48_005515 [Beauveria asiatica]|uniref:Phosphoglycerate mutase family protein n=1 Tax=Beauveria asiatica TaxID=1069075 RepID=A0AAW0RRC0_9HYPO